MLTEKPGKTLHLLKANSKPVPVGRKRRKIAAAGTFDEYLQSKKKQASDQSPADEKLFLQTGPNGQPIMAPKPNAKDAKM